MFEFIICSSVTILPDYLFRRYSQGKRIGKEINLYSMWYELRYGITACAILTISLITAIFYYHPATTNITSFFRTVTILPEAGGRVEEIYVQNQQIVEFGDPLFKIDDSVPLASLATARARIDEINAQFRVVESQLDVAQGQIDQADGALKQAQEELETRLELMARNSNVVSERDIERLENIVSERQGAVYAAVSNKESVEFQLMTVLPAQRETAISEMEKAQAELDKTVIYAGSDGRVTQFALQVGDFVSPVLRPAGILVPSSMLDQRFQAGFNQISSQVIQPGMLAEITCVSHPFVIVPMVVVDVQDVIAAGQFRPGDQLLDIESRAAPGTITVFLEPLYEEQIKPIPPGSKCVGNVYTSNHERLHSGEDLSTLEFVALHSVDTVGVVHAALLRIQALLLPVQTLVLSGHH